MSKTNPARGMRDFLPSDVRKRNYVIGVIKEVYEKYGFEPLETPAVENLDTLMGKYGEEGNQLVFKILKRGEKLAESLRENASESALSDLALRYDLTVPLARVVANNKNELPKFFKRYQIQPVWRADRPARGRFREFYQCDVDAIGSTSMTVEAEQIAAVSEILDRLGFSDYVIKVNHRQLLADLVRDSQIPDDKFGDAMTALDKLDKIGKDGVLNEMKDRGIDSGEKFLSNLENVSPNQELKQLFDIVSSRIELDASLARGLSYYTGAIFEIVLTDGDFKGSIGGGGRYDGLIGMFGKEQIPACGFSLGLERILVVMEERGMFPPEIADSRPADVMVTVWSEETIGHSLRLAGQLRSHGIKTLLYPETDKLGKQFKYADSLKIPYVCVLGESEIADKTITVKNLSKGSQKTIPLAEAIKEITS